MSLFEITLSVAASILCIGLILILIRFMKGPSLPDRVIALDVFSVTLIAIIAIYAAITDVKAYLDVAIVLSLVTFIGTMAFVYYLLHGRDKDKT